MNRVSSLHSIHDFFDVIIVGAGPAGLSGALVLGRCQRRVLLFDDGTARNAASRAVHGFFTRDGCSPADLQRIGFEQLRPYSVTIHRAHVSRASKVPGGFAVYADHTHWCGKKLLLATGVRDRELDVPGAAELTGAGVYQCPYCDGWEVRGRALGAYVPNHEAVEFALGMLTWSSDVALFTGGLVRLDRRARERLARHRIATYEAPVTAIAGEPGRLEAIVLASGERVRRDALFVHAGQTTHSKLAQELGCRVLPNGTIRAGDRQNTQIRGLYIAGDLATDVQAISVAVADGYKAGVAINRELREEQFG